MLACLFTKIQDVATRHLLNGVPMGSGVHGVMDLIHSNDQGKESHCDTLHTPCKSPLQESVHSPNKLANS